MAPAACLAWGWAKGRQKYAFLPYPESDFIFAVVGEDMGFFGCLLVLAMFAAFVFFGLRVAMRCEDRFGSLLAGGVTAMIGVQCVLNVAVVIGLMPTTACPCPSSAPAAPPFPSSWAPWAAAQHFPRRRAPMTRGHAPFAAHSIT